MSSPAKALAVAATLVGTWGVAEADTLTSTLNPTLAVDNVHFFSEAYDSSYGEGPSPAIEGSAYLSENLGSVAANEFVVDTNTIAYNSSTSTFAGAFGTSEGSIVMSAGNFAEDGFGNYIVNSYLANGTNFEDLYAAITESQIGPILDFAGGQGEGNPNGIILTDLGSGPLEPGQYNSYNAGLFVFTKTEGVVSYAGAGGANYTVNAVPEPASMAALGFGALALIRRRRRK
ncbi:MAG: PEP-CTERM sorting domain-containing protein [Cytophagaceae bacterium]|nr:MAG: PEP-CTERM sorting domain-containing protein [Cytophagaceae bacterium]